MKAKVDKFGRVLIPKKLRDLAGLEPGSEVSIVEDPITGSIIFTPVAKRTQIITITSWGWPVIETAGISPLSFGLSDFIKESRDERSDKIMGTNG